MPIGWDGWIAPLNLSCFDMPVSSSMMLPGFEMVGRQINSHTDNNIIVDVVLYCQTPTLLIQLIKGLIITVSFLLGLYSARNGET